MASPSGVDVREPTGLRTRTEQGGETSRTSRREGTAGALHVVKLKSERGMSEDEAFEIATAVFLSPADGPAMGDDPPEPVPFQEQETIWRAMFPDE